MWWQLDDLPQVTKSGNIGHPELPRSWPSRSAIDGWFFVIALVGGLVSGIALLALAPS